MLIDLQQKIETFCHFTDILGFGFSLSILRIFH